MALHQWRNNGVEGPEGSRPTHSDDWNDAVGNKSWEIGSPPTGGAGMMKLSRVVPTSLILI